MNIIPYLRRSFQTSKDWTTISGLLTENVSSPTWKINKENVINNYILEGRILRNNSFILVRGRFGLTYGRTSLLPILKGHYQAKTNDNSIVNVVVRPSISGIVILSFFYLITFSGLYIGVSNKMPSTILVCLIFISITYGSLMAKFNREADNYISFVQRIMS